MALGWGQRWAMMHPWLLCRTWLTSDTADRPSVLLTRAIILPSD
jgi:hypothetical protein